MIEAILGTIAVAALLGWTATLILLSRALLPMANAWRVWNEMDHKFDQRVQAVLDRARANTKAPVIPSGKPTAPPTMPTNPFVHGPTVPPLIPSFMDEDQPDPTLGSTDA